ncbi:MAG: flagellar motor switch protein FliN [Planctomycetes bacterium]|nr:flagellar motor switch protein FliN [Planctomycetota bacterium]MCB9884048.1 flagellar motor switch protein FliN [Planctomycetota bacterium]
MSENQAQQGGGEWGADSVAHASAELAAAAVQPVSFGPLGGGIKGEDSRNLDLLLDVEIPISVEVGRAQMSLEEVLKLVPGSVIALDKKAEEPVDLRVNGKLVARGEVVLVDDSYGLRITQIVDAAGRLESLR